MLRAAFPFRFSVGVFCAVSARSESVYSRASLSDRPIFGVFHGAAPGASFSANPELRGFFGRGGDIEVSIRNPVTGASRWVGVGETFSGWTVESVDAGAGKAVVSREGAGKVTLVLSREEIPVAPAVRPDSVPEFSATTKFSNPDLAGQEPARPGEYARRMSEGMAKLRAEHPEYFQPGLPQALQDAARAARAEVRRAAREAE